MGSLLNTHLRSQISRVWKLSVPAILTQITTIAMQYIDSAMVGNLGANASAAIGLVASSTWLMNGIGTAISTGFSVQVAQYIGAGQDRDARRVVKHGLVASMLAALVLLALGATISFPLPKLLGSDPALWYDASAYFLIFSLSMPFIVLNALTSAFLQCSGNMVTPSILNAVMCALDVLFNAFLIPRYGVLGASLGTALSVVVISLIMLWCCCIRSDALRINRKENCKLDISILQRAFKIGAPVGAEQLAMCGAMVASTRIIAPLGAVAIAANSFAITAESLCYMPGYGIGNAATTLVGQSIGAKDYQTAKRFSAITVILGCGMMTLTGIIMFLACPLVFQMLTPVVQVQTVSAQILRIGLLAEPLYGVSIVASGALRGAEDTLIPSILNLLSIWGVRLGLALLLVGPFGIHGMWVAMAVELCVRGLLLLWRMHHSKYLKHPK